MEGQTPAQVQTQEVQTPQAAGPAVSFPSVGQPEKKSGGPKFLLVLGILILLGILGFVIYKNSSKVPEGGETPETLGSISTPEPIATTEPTATASAADKSKIKIEVQNGTGISGDAAYLQTQLKNIGYTGATIGNADSQNQTTTIVTFSKNVSSEVNEEITKKLKELYKDVEVKTSSTLKTDVLVVTGLKKGATAKPSSTPTTKASATPTSTASSTPKPSATASPTASPTSTP